MPSMYISRTVCISASHRLQSPQLSVDENVKIFGKCYNVHGHNYTIKVTLYGPVDAITGMVYNLSDLKVEMDRAIMDVADHKSLDDIDYFQQVPSTTENVAIYFWSNLKKIMKNPDLLYEVKIDETNKNSVYYRGD